MTITYDKKWNIIIWGMGACGEWWYKNFLENWDGIINVIGFTDNEPCGKLINALYPNLIYNKNDTKRLYDNKKIDGVFVAAPVQYEEEISLAALCLGVPELSLPEIVLKNPDDCQGEVSEFQCEDTLVSIYTFENGYAWKEPRGACTWMFDMNFNPIVNMCNRMIKNPAGYLQYGSVPCKKTKESIKLAGKVAVLTWINSDNYSHFLLEIIDKILVLEATGFDGRYLLNDIRFVREYAELLNFSDRVIWQKSEGTTLYEIESMISVEPINHNESRMQPFLRKWAESIQEKYLANIKGKNFPKRLYVKRIGSRKVHGVDEILKEYGFETMIPEEHSVLEQLAYFYNADVVFSPHGAAVANCMFMKKGTHIIEAFGHQFIVPSFHVRIARASGVRYHMIVEDWLRRKTDHMFQRNVLADFYLDDVVLRSVIDNCIMD